MISTNFNRKYEVLKSNYIGNTLGYSKDYQTPKADYLQKSKFLSEFATLTEKDLAKLSLGVKDGVTYYTWIKYANDAEGNGISDSPEGKSYLGIAVNQTNPLASESTKDYLWSLIKLTPYEEALSKGIVHNEKEWYALLTGPLGTSITTKETIVEYQVSEQGDTIPLGSWEDKIPQLSKGLYLWIKTTITFSDDNTILFYSVSYNGLDSYIHIRYSDYPDGLNFYQIPKDSTYYIGVYDSNDPQSPDEKELYKWSKFRGDDGTDSYTHIRYSDYSNGLDFYLLPLNSTYYIGICNSDNSQAPTEKEQYRWSKFRGDNGIDSYIHIRYSDYQDGLDFYQIPKDSTYYIGICNNNNFQAPTEKELYKWSKFRGEDGIVSFESLTTDLKAELATKTVVDTLLDAASVNPISNSAMYDAFSDLLDKYRDLLNMNISLSNTITDLQNQVLHLGIPVLMVTDDEYETLEENSLLNPEALYLTTDETSAIIKDLSGSWIFGGLFPIYFGTEIEKQENAFVFPGTFPISFGTKEKE